VAVFRNGRRRRCVYVIVLELGVTWGLLARRAWIFWTALAQFLVFHALSWQVVGFFYPLLMFAILAIFPLSRLVEPRTRLTACSSHSGRAAGLVPRTRSRPCSRCSNWSPTPSPVIVR